MAGKFCLKHGSNPQHRLRFRTVTVCNPTGNRATVISSGTVVIMLIEGDGVFGQYCIVMPEQDAVLAMTGGIDVFDMQQPLDLVWDILLPAMQPDPLPDDYATHEILSKKLSNLTMIPVQGQAASSIVTQISGHTYVVDPNELEIETITLSFTGADCTVAVKTPTGEETITLWLR